MLLFINLTLLFLNIYDLLFKSLFIKKIYLSLFFNISLLIIKNIKFIIISKTFLKF